MESKLNLYYQLCEEEKGLLNRIREDTETLNAVRVLKKRYQPEGKSDEEDKGQVKLFPAPDVNGTSIGYSVGMTIPNKVLYALKAIDQGEVQDMVKSLLFLEPKYGEVKAQKDVKHWISRLHKDGKALVLRKGSGKRSGLYKYVG